VPPADSKPPVKPGEVKLDVPFVVTPEEIVDEMLKMAKVGDNDVVYDLGCGDGRIVITAVKRFKAKRGVGIDIDPARVVAHHTTPAISERGNFLARTLCRKACRLPG